MSTGHQTPVDVLGHYIYSANKCLLWLKLSRQEKEYTVRNVVINARLPHNLDSLQCDSHQAHKHYSDTLHCLYAAVCLVESRSRVTRTFPRRGVEPDRISNRIPKFEGVGSGVRWGDSASGMGACDVHYTLHSNGTTYRIRAVLDRIA
jgi:hypothetical protein